MNMAKHRAIPKGYMTVGGLAKKMNTTVRTLQYYDKEGVLSPSAESEGGRRLYTDKDIIRLHQIQSMKYLGFSLDDIKNRLVSLETPADVAGALSEQAAVIREKIASLSEVLQAVEKLSTETLQMQTVDWGKYADIVINLQMKNEYYGLIKHFDDKTLEHLHTHFDKESGTAILSTMNRLFDEVAKLKKNGIPPESEQGQSIAKAWWDMVTEFTGGDTSLLPGLMKFTENKESWAEGWKERWPETEAYLHKALETYFTNLGYDPLEGAGQ